MKFRLKTLSMLAAAAALTLTGCSNDDLALEGGVTGNTDYSGRVVYLNAGIALPTVGGTRSATDEEGDGDGKTNSDGTFGKEDNSDFVSGEDFEYGHDYESEVRSVLLVLTNANDELMTYSVVGGLTKAPTPNSAFDVTAQGEIKYEDLEEAYTEGGVLAGTDKTVNVYAFCNYTARLLSEIKKATVGKADWINLAGEVVEPASPVNHTPDISNTIWAKRSFLMSNAEKVSYTFPATLKDWEKYADKATPYELTENPAGTTTKKAIPVERASARLDFRDGSGNENTYALTVDTGNEKLNLVSVRLNRMALVNMSKHFYYLRRVSADGTMTGAVVGGVENRNNYVVDTDWAAKQKVKGIGSGSESEKPEAHFNFCLYTEDGKAYNPSAWYADKITDVVNGKEDDNWNNTQNLSYKIWRYVTENTIPSGTKPDDFSQQKTVQSTGIVFKGSIIAGDDIDEAGSENYMSDAVKAALTEAAKDDAAEENLPILYSFDNLLYAGVEDIVAGALREGDGSPLYLAVEQALNHWRLKDGKYTYDATYTGEVDANSLTVVKADKIFKGEIEGTVVWEEKKGEETIDIFSTIAPDNQITVYRATNEGDGDGWGYYCYYFYWNRHNDNGLNGKMGIMEFATVRNNVYKLAVTAIGKLGHPRDTSDDPDPVEEEDPDEEPLNYIQVKVEVLPWVVRVNNIVFD